MKLTYGLIGGGNGAFIGNVHRVGAAIDCSATLVAGCFTRNAEKNAACAEEWNVFDKSRVYANYEEMAEKEAAREDGIDFVTIATPNDTHYPIAKAFLSRGIDIMCDKPLSMTIEESEELVALSKEKGLLFGMTYSFAGYAMIREAREIIDSGKLGKIMHVSAEYPQDWLIVNLDKGVNIWRLDKSKAGESSVTADIATHLEHAIYAMTGLEIKSVLASFDYFPEGLELETNANILLKFGNGVSGALWASQIAIGEECNVKIRVYGTKGSVEWYHDRASLLKLSYLNQPVQYLSQNRDYLSDASRAMSRIPYGSPEGYFEAFANLYKGFCAELSNKKYGTNYPVPYYPNADHGLHGMKFVAACIKSANNNNIWVNLEDMK